MDFLEKKVELIHNGVSIFTGHQGDVREKIEEMLLKELGFCPDMQEDTEDGEFFVYVHTDTFEEDLLSEEQLQKLEELEITDFNEQSTKAIKKLLNVEFNIVGDWVIESKK